MKYLDQIWKGFITSTILLFSFSIIIYIFFPVRYIGIIDATVLIKVILILAFTGIIMETIGGFVEK